MVSVKVYHTLSKLQHHNEWHTSSANQWAHLKMIMIDCSQQQTRQKEEYQMQAIQQTKSYKWSGCVKQQAQRLLADLTRTVMLVKVSIQ